MENRLKLVTIGPDRRPRLVPRSGRRRGSRPAAIDRAARHLGWAERVARRSAWGRGAPGWGGSRRTLAMHRAPVLVAGVRTWPVEGPPGRSGRDGRLDLTLRLILRAEGGRAERRQGEPPRTLAPPWPASRPVERVLERMRLSEGGERRGRSAAEAGEVKRIAPLDRAIAGVVAGLARTPGAEELGPSATTAKVVVTRAPAAVARVLAVPVPAPAPPAPPVVPQWDQPRPAPMPPKLLSAVMTDPSIAAFPPAVVEQLTDRVVRAIDRRVISARERFGLGPG